jgi:hypothetical protein
MRVSGHAISVEVPAGWEARIFRRKAAPPVLHAATMALWDGDGAYGAAATGRMRRDDVFFALVEFRADNTLRPGEGLYAPHGPPAALTAGDFSVSCLQVTRQGQLGCQRFFTAGIRPFCLYAVMRPGSRGAAGLVEGANSLLATLRIEP